MKRTFRKLTIDDFRVRVERLDPHYARYGEVETAPASTGRPRAAMALGFLWVILLAWISRNRDGLEGSLNAGALSADVVDMILGGLAALLAVSSVMIVMHLVRAVLSDNARRGSSGSLMAGALGAVMLVYMPATVMKAGYGLVDASSGGMISRAGMTVETATGIDLGAVMVVASR